MPHRKHHLPTGQAQPELLHKTNYIVARFPAEREEIFMEKGKIFCDLIHMAVSKGITVKFAPLGVSYARIKGDRIALSQSLGTIDDFNYNLAHELAHAYLHYDKGDIMASDDQEEYEKQADRGAQMLIEALEATQKGVESGERS